MIKLNRTTEYGLIALRHMDRKRIETETGRAFTSAREIADTYGLPFEITAKTLQRLKDRGMIQSEQGARGGYLLQRTLDQVTLGEFLAMMEGPQAVVPCADAPTTGACEYSSKCEMQSVMSKLNQKVTGFLSTIRLSDLVDPIPVPVSRAVPAIHASSQEIFLSDPIAARLGGEP